KKRGFESELDTIEGIGRKTRAILLKAFGSVKAIANASAEALVAAGSTRKQADAIAAHFRSSAEETEASEELAVEHAFDEEVTDAEAVTDTDADAVADAVAMAEADSASVTDADLDGDSDSDAEERSDPEQDPEPDAFAGRQLN